MLFGMSLIILDLTVIPESLETAGSNGALELGTFLPKSSNSFLLILGILSAESALCGAGWAEFIEVEILTSLVRLQFVNCLFSCLRLGVPLLVFFQNDIRKKGEFSEKWDRIAGAKNRFRPRAPE